MEVSVILFTSASIHGKNCYCLVKVSTPSSILVLAKMNDYSLEHYHSLGNFRSGKKFLQLQLFEIKTSEKYSMVNN